MPLPSASDAPVCLVTGGTSGIGLATCLRFAQAGYRVATCSRDEGRVQAAAQHVREAVEQAVMLTYVADVGRSEQVRHFVAYAHEQYGRIDVLVNNAGIAPRAPLEQMPLDDLWRALDVNVVSVFSSVQAVWQIMREQGGGTVVNVTSLAAVAPIPGLGLYGSCKSWVEAFTRTAAEESRGVGVRMFAVRPGAVETPMLRGLFPDYPPESTLQPSAVADLIYQICGPAFEHCTGQVFEIKR